MRLSKNWLVVLEKDQKRRFINGYHFDLNSYALGHICDDKYALCELLKSLNIPTVEYELVYKPIITASFAKDANNSKSFYKYFYKNNQNIVMKSTTGSTGNEVFHITCEEDIKPISEQIFTKNNTICLCPYYDIKNEYRVIALNGQIKLIYKKIKPVVIGDGQSTLLELLIKFNKPFFEKNKNLKEYDYNQILPKDEIFEYNWQFNLCGGASLTLDIDKNILNELNNIASDILQKIDLKFASIDIIELKNNKKLVLEINSGIMLNNFINITEDGYNIAKEIYKEAIKSLFNS